jgi:hypothetical protein
MHTGAAMHAGCVAHAGHQRRLGSGHKGGGTRGHRQAHGGGGDTGGGTGRVQRGRGREAQLAGRKGGEARGHTGVREAMTAGRRGGGTQEVTRAFERWGEAGGGRGAVTHGGEWGHPAKPCQVPYQVCVVVHKAQGGPGRQAGQEVPHPGLHLHAHGSVQARLPRRRRRTCCSSRNTAHGKAQGRRGTHGFGSTNDGGDSVEVGAHD